MGDLGTPPEDEPGVEEGAPEPVSIAPATEGAKHASSLASRIDAMLVDDIDVDDAPDAAPDAMIDASIETSTDAAIDFDDLEEIEESKPITISPPPLAVRPSVPAFPPPPPPPPMAGRPVVVVPPRVPSSPPAMRASPVAPRPPAIPRAAPPIAVPTVGIPTASRAIPTISVPPPKDGEAPPATPPERPSGLDIAMGSDLAQMSEGMEVSTETPNIVVDQPLEAALESPTVVDRALEELGDVGGEKRAETLAKDLEATTDPAAAAYLAYELGELYERRLADEARAVKAYGRALTLDPGLRPNLWAIRRVFYRRGLWPNLVKLIGAEVTYARDDYERADLLLEKARVAAYHMNDARGGAGRARRGGDARAESPGRAARARADRGAARVTSPRCSTPGSASPRRSRPPQRKIAYWLEVGRTAGAREYDRAQNAFEQATALAAGTSAAERIARERVRVAEDHGSPEDVAAAIDELATLLLATFGPAGAAADPAQASEASTDRATMVRRELVALRRRQAQIARTDTPERAWDILQQALALSPGEPLVLADLTELAEELGRYDDLAELVQSWQAVEGDPGRAMVLSIRRADALLRGGQRDQARALLASLEASAPGFVVLTSAAERDALGRADAARSREDVPVRGARRAARHLARTRAAAGARSGGRRRTLRPGRGAARVRGWRARGARRGARGARQGARGRTRAACRPRGPDRARRHDRPRRRGARAPADRGARERWRGAARGVRARDPPRAQPRRARGRARARARGRDARARRSRPQVAHGVDARAARPR